MMFDFLFNYLARRKARRMRKTIERSISDDHSPSIYFRELSPAFRGTLRGYRLWQVECQTDFMAPACIAWVIVNSDDPTDLPMLDYILTLDHERKKGFAKLVFTKCVELWPDIQLSPAMSAEGQAFIEWAKREFGCRDPDESIGRTPRKF